MDGDRRPVSVWYDNERAMEFLRCLHEGLPITIGEDHNDLLLLAAACSTLLLREAAWDEAERPPAGILFCPAELLDNMAAAVRFCTDMMMRATSGLPDALPPTPFQSFIISTTERPFWKDDIDAVAKALLPFRWQP